MRHRAGPSRDGLACVAQCDGGGERDGGGFYAEDARAERDLLPAGGDGRGDFGVGEAAFGADGELRGERFAQVDVCERLARGVGEEAAIVAFGFPISDFGLNPLAPRLRFSDLHESVAAALFGGFDDRAAQAFGGAGGGLGDAALGDERHERGDAELGQFFDEPLLAVAFRQRDADGQLERQFAINRSAFDDSHDSLRIGAAFRRSR